MLDNIQKAVLTDLPDCAVNNFFLFPEQGNAVISYHRDLNGKIHDNILDLVTLYNIAEKPISEEDRNTLFQYLSHHPKLTDMLTVTVIKKYGFIMKIKRLTDISDEAYNHFVMQTTSTVKTLLAEKYPNYEVACSRTSIGIFLKGANKSLALRYMTKI